MNFFVVFILIILSWQDIRKKKINILLCIIAICFILLINLLFHLNSLIFMISGIFVGGFVVIVSYITKGAIGIGDGVAFMITGLAAGGIINIEILIISLFLSSIAGMYQLTFKKCNRKKTMAFVPFITIGFILKKFII